MRDEGIREVPLTRILYANPTAKASGAEFSLLALMGNLDRKIYEPLLLCPMEGLLPQLCRKRDIKTYFLPTIPPPLGRPIDAYRTLLLNAWSIKRLIQTLNVQLVHANTPRMAYHTGLAARWAGIPHITHVRNINASPFASPLKARFLNYLSDRIITVSQATKAAVTQHFPDTATKVQVIYNGIGQAPQFDAVQLESLRIEFGATSGTRLLATIGQITPWKGLEVAIRALSSILERYPDTCLLIVGESLWDQESSYTAQLGELAEQLGVFEQVIFTGFRQDIPLILAAIDVLIHCPVEPDPLPRILLEAGAQETLVVASNIGGIAEIVQDRQSGLLVPPGEPAALADAVMNVLSDPLLAACLRSAAGRRIRESFSIDQHVMHIETIYRTLLGQE